MNKKRFHAINDVAETFGVSPFTIRRGIKAGLIRSLGICGRVLVPDEELERIAREGLPRRSRDAQPVSQ